jgi:acyl dehydratase
MSVTTGPPAPDEAVPFDDIEALNAMASDAFGAWGPEVEVTQELINGFADLTGDHQWIHVDVERAKAESPFGGPVAHGFLTLSLLPMLAVQPVKVKNHRSGTNYGADKLRFLSPVVAGSCIHARSRVCRADPHRRGTLITAEVEVSVVGSEKPAVIYRMQYLYS